MTIDTIKWVVDKKFTTEVKFENNEPKYVFTHKQTGATTSCSYDAEDYHHTLKELLGFR